jgi:uncharacterized protein (UPF0332 family)
MTDEQKWDLVQYRLENAKKTFAEVDVLLQNKLYNTAVSRLYYACFYAVSALLLQNDIQTKTHAGARKIFGLHFVDKDIIPGETGRFYTKLFDLRHDGDYQDYIDYDLEEVLILIKPAEDLMNQIQAILFKQ